VSMGWSAARKLRTSLDNLARILSVELVTAARALQLRAPLQPAPGTAAAAAVLLLAGTLLAGCGPKGGAIDAKAAPSPNPPTALPQIRPDGTLVAPAALQLPPTSSARSAALASAGLTSAGLTSAHITSARLTSAHFTPAWQILPPPYFPPPGFLAAAASASPFLPERRYADLYRTGVPA